MFHRLKKYVRQLSLFKTKATHKGPQPRTGINTEIHDSDVSPLTSVGKNCYLYKTSLGAFTYLSQNVNIMNTTIGKFCSIGQGVCISAGIHPSSTFVSTHPAFYSLHKQSGATFAKENHFREMGNTTIGNDVWIGTNAIIMDDITIGDGAIIGAGAIVTKNVLPYSIVVGNPAKHLRFRFEKDEIDFLLVFKWWDKDLSWIEKHYTKFHDIKSFVKDNRGNS